MSRTNTADRAARKTGTVKAVFLIARGQQNHSHAAREQETPQEEKGVIKGAFIAKNPTWPAYNYLEV